MDAGKKQVQASKVIGYRKLFAWQKSDGLAREVYRVTQGFPNSELFGLASQLKRAAISVPTNIVEGYARVSKNEFKHFLSITLGSLAEVEYLLLFARQQNFIKGEDYKNLISLREECGRLVWRLYLSQKS